MVSGSRFIGLLLAFCLALGLASCDEGVQLENEGNAGKFWSELEQSKLALLKEVSELKSQVSILESNLKDAKRESIEKSRKILSLEGELDAFQKRNGGDFETRLQQSESKLEDSAKQIKRLEKSLKHYEKLAKESEQRLAAAEAKNAELSSQNAKLEKTASELRKKLRDAEETLRIAEAAMLNAQAEAASKSQELYKVYEAWLPPWAASRLAQLQATSMTYWALHGDPFMKTATGQMSQHAATAKKWAEPHVNTFREKVAPVAYEYWQHVAEAAKTNSNSMRAKLREGYAAAKLHSSPYVAKARDQVLPYVQIIRERGRPYVDQAAIRVRPFYEKGRDAVHPHVNKARDAYQHAINYFQVSQQQVKKTLRSKMMQHEATTALAASEEILSFLAIALIVLPALAGVLIVSSVFRGTRPAKRSPSRSTNGNKKHHRRSSAKASA